MHVNIFEVSVYLYFITLFNIHIPEVKQRKQNIGPFISIVFSFPYLILGTSLSPILNYMVLCSHQMSSL